MKSIRSGSMRTFRSYIKAEEAYSEAEKRVQDWPYEMKLPLCPEDVRAQAERLRSTPEAITDQESSEEAKSEQSEDCHQG